ncbi:hypothetical protein VIC_000205 [Vibrio coralliilyticus ATCC BAA-450]|nr:hypothetical protein VIC_000205 [Vibrio coralliilyticus ATCC BAA-450]
MFNVALIHLMHQIFDAIGALKKINIMDLGIIKTAVIPVGKWGY